MTSIGFNQQFDSNVSSIVATFLVKKPMKFVDGIIPFLDKLDWCELCTWLDPSVLMKHKDTQSSSFHDKIDWYYIGLNKN
jgi:hypothetical protein